jgi:type II secretory pathway pseudopilin PulG
MIKHPSQPIPRRGLAMIEAVVSMIIVSVMLAAALRTVGASRVGQVKNSDALKGHYLAMDLMSEMLDLSYSDPDGLALFGQELGEVLGVRAGFDDVDDYHNWSQETLLRRDGTEMPGFTGWARSVQVHWVNPSDLSVKSVVETNVKQITITVTRGGVVAARLSAVRSAVAPR